MSDGIPGRSAGEVVSRGGVSLVALDVGDDVLASAVPDGVLGGASVDERLLELVGLPLLLFNRRNAAKAAASRGVVGVPGSLAAFEEPLGSPDDSAEGGGVSWEVGVGVGAGGAGVGPLARGFVGGTRFGASCPAGHCCQTPPGPGNPGN